MIVIIYILLENTLNKKRKKEIQMNSIIYLGIVVRNSFLFLKVENCFSYLKI